jgi:Secretion system C-terminal sorting domain
MLVFPNPAGDLVKIELVDRQDAIQAIELFDQMGRLVYSIKSQEKSPALQLNLQNLAQGSALQFTQSGIIQGVYLIRCITNKNFVYNSKLIIQK